MTHYRLLRRAALAGALALPILTTGCGLFSQQTSQSIDPPQNSAAAGNAAVGSSAAVDGTAASGTAAVDGTAASGTAADDGTAASGTAADDGTAASGTAADDGTAASGTAADDGTAASGTAADNGTAASSTAADNGKAANGTAAAGNSASSGSAASQVGGQAAEDTDSSQMTVYLKNDDGLLAPVTISAALGAQEKAGQKALEMMVDGGPYAKELPDGFQAVLPKGTQVKSFDIVKDQKMAVVDFSKSFTDYNAADERQLVEAVTWTLTGMDGVDKVQLQVEGQTLTEMPVAGMPIDEPITRAVGINLEEADGVDITRSTPVTLYFSAVTPNDETYYVPVTRLVDRSDNRAKAAVQQLIDGPLDTHRLTPVITPDVTVKDVTKKSDVVTVNLQDNGYQDGMQEPAEMMEAIVLSLTENTGADKVQIVLNGKTDVTDTNNQSYSQPVSRPEHMNPFKS
ncbi:GerMN domain-containing protein [Paenibacillus humicola]|uniref:GerMN domain-containing protein n=1 Tax=Paenibacillus humicola TaxID=3110540 RepID=UPI00237ADDF3|nr:GerMN domain-containing protein [Paenibacillus humicola]